MANEKATARKTGSVASKTAPPRVRDLSTRDALRLAIIADTSEDTARRWARGERVNEGNDRRLSAAASKLNLGGSA